MADLETIFIEGNEKREVYAALKVRLSSAMRGGFWFEACMIEYAIIEDRTSSILSHGKVCKDPYSSSRLLKNKLNSILQQIGKGHPIISKKVSSEVIERIIAWRDRRNDAVHRACIRPYSEEEIRGLAEEGRELVRLLSNDSNKVARAAKKAAKASAK